MSAETIPVAIVGATGYAGEGSLRILLGHPNFTIVHAGSDRLAGTPVSEALPALAAECPDLVLAPDTPELIISSGAKAVILAKKSPDVTKIVPQLLSAGVKIVDIGAEFRLRSLEAYQTFYGEEHACPETLADAVYGLSEINTEAIKAAQLVGNPGCYPTSILIPLIPLMRKQFVNVDHDIVSISYSGVSGAGKQYVEKNNNLFYAMDGNLHSYKALAHQHVGEVDQELSLAAGQDMSMCILCRILPQLRAAFIPVLVAGSTLMLHWMTFLLHGQTHMKTGHLYVSVKHPKKLKSQTSNRLITLTSVLPLMARH